MPVSGTERSVPLAEAARRVTATLVALGLEAHLTELGNGTEPTAWRCELRTPGGDVAPEAQGAGKGTREEARVGALFEALEHHLTGPAHFEPAAVEHVPAAAVAQHLAGDVIAPLLQEAMSAPLACHRYRRLHTSGPAPHRPRGADHLTVPVFLPCPWYIDEPAWRHRAGDGFDYAPVGRYCCNSGSAIGVSAAEAAVHALNEAIERDAFSLLLARTFLGGRRLRVIDPATLPGDLAHALEVAGQHAGQPVHLLDVTGWMPQEIATGPALMTARSVRRRQPGAVRAPAGRCGPVGPGRRCPLRTGLPPGRTQRLRRGSVRCTMAPSGAQRYMARFEADGAGLRGERRGSAVGELTG
ncbi:YcaO-like family protein [Streptomyces chrestomyceticus]|uniref:YcaO-like family protein n=1 Tax=Streptomyces chrestomyceticus TaxID=68185 RepID=UPI0033D7FB87